MWKVGLDEFAASRVGVGGRFVRCLNAEEAERECWSFHPGEVGGEGEILLLLFVAVCVRRRGRFQVCRKFVMVGTVRMAKGGGWTSEGGPDSGVGEVSVTDRFDRAFGLHFRELEGLDDIIEALIPEDWLRSEFMKQLSDEEKAKIESLGGLEKLIEEFKKRLEEQKKRHQGGNKWIGTGGTSAVGGEV